MESGAFCWIIGEMTPKSDQMEELLKEDSMKEKLDFNAMPKSTAVDKYKKGLAYSQRRKSCPDLAQKCKEKATL